MRLYTFGNMYMSSIQQGIQACHSQKNLFMKYKDYDSNHVQKISLFDWAAFHETMICLNGGMNKDLQEIEILMKDHTNPYPWSSFRESEEAMQGMLTNIAIVLPEKIYDLAKRIRNKELFLPNLIELDHISITDKDDISVNSITSFQANLIKLLNSKGLAR